MDVDNTEVQSEKAVDKEQPAVDANVKPEVNGDKQDNKPEEPKEKTMEFTQKQLDEMFSKRFKKFKDEEQEAKRLASMSESDREKELIKKAQQEKQDLSQQIADLQKQITVSQLKQEAGKQISAKGLTVSDDVLNMLTTDNADTTKTNIENYAKAVADQAEALKQQALSNPKPPKVAGGQDVHVETIEEKIAKNLAKSNIK